MGKKMQDKFGVQVHRFRNGVAVYIGNGQTVYLHPKDARKLSRAINKAARSCETEEFADSSFKTFGATFESHY